MVQSITPEINAIGIGWGLGKVFLAGITGVITAYVCIIPGYIMLQD